MIIPSFILANNNVRKLWVDHLCRISYPILRYTAMDSLKIIMPVYSEETRSFQYLESLGRTICGIAPWIELSDGNDEESLLRKEIREYAIKAITNVDYFIDGSGFAFSDQWHPTVHTVKSWEYHLRRYKEQGTKIVFLPQAFGPANLQTTKDVLMVLNNYADVIMPRENVSLQYLIDSGLNKDKIKKYTDFTSLVQGIFPKKYEHLKDGICIIPNLRMIDKGIISLQDYISLLVGIMKSASVIGRPVYLLNHEGKGDENLAYKCREKLSASIEVVTGLNALEVKGLIASSYLCISSRFHGVASSLNSSVPCLSTSWSHKYEELYKDYGLSGSVLDITDINKCLSKVSEYLSTDVNDKIRNILDNSVPKIKTETIDMWEYIWNI